MIIISILIIRMVGLGVREGKVSTLEGSRIRPRPGIFRWNGVDGGDLGLQVLG